VEHQPTTGPPDVADLRVLLIGGIYGFPDRLGVVETPETTLERGLGELGVSVTTQAHNWQIRRGSWDIVHVHHLAKQALVQAVRCAGRRLVFTRHGITPVTGIRSSALGLVLRRSDAVIALSSAEEFALRSRVPGDRLACIPNGIRQQQWPYSLHEPPTAGHPWRMLFVGQLAPVKGVEVLLESVASLIGRFDIELRLVYQTDSLLDALRQRAAALSITGALTFVGFRTPVQLRDEYRDAHVLVLPSRHEALPSVVTEAMLSGLPVVASDVGGIAEQIGDHGEIVPPGDAAALSQAIANVFSDYGTAVSRADQAAQGARDRFSIEAMVEAHVRLYQNVLSGQRRRMFAAGP
jgi:glycosyltransferase involved in cell wall biosynthesis